jgi:hypothetical protein
MKSLVLDLILHLLLNDILSLQVLRTLNLKSTKRCPLISQMTNLLCLFLGNLGLLV